MTIPIAALYVLWAAWLVSWVMASLWSTRTAERATVDRALLYRSLQALGAAALFFTPTLTTTSLRLADALFSWSLVAAAGCGFLFCWWARLHLGRLWSGSVQKKEGHHVVASGPYGIVRHPIYTGLIVAAYALAAAKATLLAWAGASLMTLGWYLKARTEERFLRTSLGVDAYAAYSTRVPMLVPLLPF